jgi:type II secretory pathway predicted ATPase ExeA
MLTNFPLLKRMKIMIDIKKYYKISKIPFSNDIDVSKLLITEAHKEILSRLKFAAQEQKFVVFTAECGAGKTTLLRLLKKNLSDDKYQIFYISDSDLTPRLIYKHILLQLNIDTNYYRGDSKALLHSQLEFLKSSKNKKIITIIDEAHLLTKKAIEEVRFLLNYKMDSYAPMALILVGQPELKDKLYKRNYEAVRQRINMVCKLNNLNREESEEYIKTHLTSVGYKKELFTQESIDFIYESSQGSPRVINNICYQSLINNALVKGDLIKTPLVKNVCNCELL